MNSFMKGAFFLLAREQAATFYSEILGTKKNHALECILSLRAISRLLEHDDRWLFYEQVRLTGMVDKTLEVFAALSSSSSSSPQRETVIEEVAVAVAWMLLRSGGGGVFEDKASGDLCYPADAIPQPEPLCNLIEKVASCKLSAHLCTRLRAIVEQPDPDPAVVASVAVCASSLEEASKLCRLVRLLLELSRKVSPTNSLSQEALDAEQLFSAPAFTDVLVKLLRMEIHILRGYRSRGKGRVTVLDWGRPIQRSIRRMRMFLRTVSVAAGVWRDVTAQKALDQTLLAHFAPDGRPDPSILLPIVLSACPSAIAVEEFGQLSLELKSAPTSLLSDMRRYFELSAMDPALRLTELQRHLLREEGVSRDLAARLADAKREIQQYKDAATDSTEKLAACAVKLVAAEETQWRDAEQEVQQLQIDLGKTFISGAPKDENAAVSLYRKVAARGHVDSQYMLGVWYEYGIYVGSKDEQEAKYWYGLAATKGHGDAVAKLANAVKLTYLMQDTQRVAQAIHQNPQPQRTGMDSYR
eukprot:gene31498-40906_t